MPVNCDKGQNLVRDLPTALKDSPNIFSDLKRCMMDALDGLRKPKRSSQKPLRVPLDAVYLMSGIGIVLCGKIETGELNGLTALKVVSVGPRLNQET